MKKSILISLLVLPFIFTSCGPSKTKLSEQIKNVEKSLYENPANGFSREKADTLLTLYKNYLEKFPGDTLEKMYTFNIASLAMNLEKSDDAIKYFDIFIQKYPDNPRTPVCVFFKGYIYENQIHNLDKAKEIYLNFLEKYPNSDFADDARNSLANLGKTPEQMVAEFEKKQKEDSIAAATASKRK